ncbi:hemerythrin domain-containing protein [Candidatus Protofrankia californiensis]|uniref:hemerythrin domain-containing protein n=1 Tax=Candidatus Protofrankia californiensis TaxID=1839754 RepID=UPI00104175DA|nr:hemerythrin domain-containing protein [Candidatus Protofrankia californiensis]
MSKADEERAQAARLPQDDVVGILLEQHARIRDLFADVKTAEGEHKQQAFDELRALLAVHETGEEMVLRPVTRDVAGAEVSEARNHEEEAANRVLAELEKMDVGSAEFDTRLAQFEMAVLEHAEHEEQEEFPTLHPARAEEQLQRMGRRLRTAEKIAPTHPHPAIAGSTTAQWAVGPFASLVDRVKDAVK